MQITTEERHGQWLLIAGGILLGTIGVFVEEANQNPLVTVWFRCIFGALALWLWSMATGRSGELRLNRKSYWIAIATGLLILINWTLFFAAIPRTSIAVATVVFHIQPFWVMIFGLWFLRETVSPLQWVATIMAFCGLTLTTGLSFNDLMLGAVNDEYITGLLMCLGGSVSYAAVTVIAKTETKITSFALAWWQCAVGSVVLAWAPLVYGWPSQISAWPWLIGLGVFHTGLAYAILFAGMAKLTLGKVALLQFIYPLTAIVVDWMIYGRLLDHIQLIGVAMMAIALWTVRKTKIQ